MTLINHKIKPHSAENQIEQGRGRDESLQNHMKLYKSKMELLNLT